MRSHFVGVFIAVDESGQSELIEVWQDVQDGQRGLKSLRLPDGTPVNRIEQGRYQVLDGGDFPILITDDPAAP